MAYSILERIPLPPHPEAEYFQVYTTRLRGITTLLELVRMAEYWKPLAIDMQKIVSDMTDKEFDEIFLPGLKQEFEFDTYAGTAWHTKYIHIFLPDVLFVIDMVAKAYRIPWGTAYNRLLTLETLIIDDYGIVNYLGPKK